MSSITTDKCVIHTIHRSIHSTAGFWHLSLNPAPRIRRRRQTSASLTDVDLSAGQLHGLNWALSEAVCRGVDVDAADRVVSLSLDVLTLTDAGSTARPIVVSLTGVGRLAASLRYQLWNDAEPTVERLELDQLSSAVASFGGCRLHGWEFIDLPDSSWTQWGHLLSLDTTLSDAPSAHVLEFTQEEGASPRELDLRIWFDSVSIRSDDGEPITVDDLVAGGVTWWSAHDAGDPRTLSDDIAPTL